MTGQVWPKTLTFSRGRRVLDIVFDDGVSASIPFEFLRRNSPSAEVRGHGAGPRPPEPVIVEGLNVDRAEPVGRYAVRIYFSDGHSSGLFTWPYLRELADQVLEGAV